MGRQREAPVPKKKAPRWKGGSGSSNPATTTHRNKARAAFSKFKVGGTLRNQRRGRKTGLTAKDLAAHAILQDKSEKDAIIQPDAPEDTGTMAIFQSVRRLWNSPMESHREACAVLAAVTESIKANNVEESPTAYWASLLTALESTQGLEDHKAVTAILMLLSLVTSQVPKAVLQSKFSFASSLLLDTLMTFNEAESSNAVLKSTVVCLLAIFNAQDEATWGGMEATKNLRMLLAFVGDPRAKVRKAAQAGFTALLTEKENHPGIPCTAQFVSQALEQALSGKVEEHTLLHLLGFVKTVAHVFPSAALKNICESLLRLLKSAKPVTAMLIVSVFEDIFRLDHTCKLSVTVHEQLLDALLELRPADADTSPLCAWNNVVTAGHMKLSQSHLSACIGRIPVLSGSLVSCFLSDKKELAKNAARNLTKLISEAFGKEQVLLTQAVQAQAAGNAKTPIHKIIKSYASALRYRYQQNYKLVMGVIAAMFTALGKHCIPLASDIIISLLDLHETPKLKCKPEIEDALQAGIQAAGPNAFLQLVPLELESPEVVGEFPRAWLLPLLKDAVSHSTIRFFGVTLMPLAARLVSLSEQAKEEGQDLIAKTYDTLAIQVWDLLPGFFTSPTDVATSFKNVAKSLGANLSEQPRLCVTICKALQNLIKTAEKDEDKAAVGQFAKNFLPLLFNVYSSSIDNQKHVVLSTIESFAAIADPRLLNTFFKNVIKRLLEANDSLDPAEVTQAKHDMMDLAMTLTATMDEECIGLLYRVIKPQLQDEDSTLQKKSYRALDSLLSCDSDRHKAFVTENVADLQTTIVEAFVTSKAASKLPRLRCIFHLHGFLPASNLMEFIPKSIVEVIMAIKEVNERVRTIAYNILVGFGEKIVAMTDQGESLVCIDEYINVVLAGLGGQSPHMMSAAILALARLVYQFHTMVTEPLINTLIETVFLLLQSNAREVVKSCLGFVRVVLAVCSHAVLRPHLPSLVEGMLGWKRDMKGAFRMKVKVILERLIRKFSYEEIEALVPQEHHKLIVNIRKTKERAKRKPNTNGEVEEENQHAEKPARNEPQSYDDIVHGLDDSDSEQTKPMDTDSRSSKAKKKTKGNELWINEGDEDTPLNLLGSDLAHQVVATKPSKKRKSDSKGFEHAEDGRMMITDPEDPKNAANKLDIMSDDESDDENDGITFGSGIHRDRRHVKRVRRGNEDDEEEDDDASSRKKQTKPAIGAEYRSKRAAGDVMKKGKPMPFAYMPLNRQQLNRRKGKQQGDSFKGVVKSAKLGAKTARRKKQGRK